MPRRHGDKPHKSSKPRRDIYELFQDQQESESSYSSTAGGSSTDRSLTYGRQGGPYGNASYASSYPELRPVPEMGDFDFQCESPTEDHPPENAFNHAENDIDGQIGTRYTEPLNTMMGSRSLNAPVDFDDQRQATQAYQDYDLAHVGQAFGNAGEDDPENSQYGYYTTESPKVLVISNERPPTWRSANIIVNTESTENLHLISLQFLTGNLEWKTNHLQPVRSSEIETDQGSSKPLGWVELRVSIRHSYGYPSIKDVVFYAVDDKVTHGYDIIFGPDATLEFDASVQVNFGLISLAKRKETQDEKEEREKKERERKEVKRREKEKKENRRNQKRR